MVILLFLLCIFISLEMTSLAVESSLSLLQVPQVSPWIGLGLCVLLLAWAIGD